MRPPRPRPVLAATAAALALAASAHATPTALPLPGPAPRGRPAGFDAEAEGRACEACHAEIAGEWRRSLHRRSWEDPIFATAYALERDAFCRGCHAPEADPARPPGAGARRVGVGCVTCHLEAGEVVGVRARTGAGAHPVRADPRLGTSAACEPCHEFAFPRPQRSPMQGTAREHRDSPHAAESCQSCHMPRVRDAGGRAHRSHDFRVLGDAEKLRSAVVARAAREGDRAVTVTLATGRVGHAFPTGDMFRRLEVRARAGEGGDEVRATPVVLTRRFAVKSTPEGPFRFEIGDDRLPASGEEREVALVFLAPVAGRAVRWEVAYQRMDRGMAAAFGVDPQADEAIVAGGVLPPTPGRR